MKRKLSVILSGLVLLLVMGLGSSKVSASTLPGTTAPESIVICSVNGSEHVAESKLFAKVWIDGESNYSNFTKATCACGAQVFYDGNPPLGSV